MSIILLLLQFLNTSLDIEQPAVVFESNSGNVIVVVDNIKHMKGELLVGIYKNKKTFRKVKRVYDYAVARVGNGKEKLILENIPHGVYAIAIFQDFNGNKKFDTNFMGIPKEPFGFSTNFKVKRRAPKFKEVTFTHNGPSTIMNINLQEF